MSTFPDAYSVHNAAAAMKDIDSLQELPSKKAYDKPTAENATRGKELINFLMQDKFFLALLRSNDPGVRAGAIDKLTKAHYQAYGD